MIKRGDIYYIKEHPAAGSEYAGARPGVIVSNDILNRTSPVVMVVYLTTKPKKEMPTHATLEATGRTSTALCEQIDSVSVDLLDRYLGACNDDEMNAIDDAMLAALGIELEEDTVAKEDVDTMINTDAIALARAYAERDVYKGLVEKLTGVGT